MMGQGADEKVIPKKPMVGREDVEAQVIPDKPDPAELHDGKKKKRKKNYPEKLKIPTTQQSKANAATEFVSAIFCRRFIRNLTATLTVQFLAISSIIFLIHFEPHVRRMVSSQTRTLVIVNGSVYFGIALTMLFVNKFYRKAGPLNYIPLLLITCNIGCLLAIPVIQYKMYEVLIVVLVIAFYLCVMTGCQLLFHWELSLPTGLLGISFGNTVIGCVVLGVSTHAFKRPSQCWMLFVLQIITTSISAYILYSIELMTTEPGVHKLHQYQIVYENHAYAALHVFTDYISLLLTFPKYIYYCARPKFRKAWYQGFVPRSGIGMACGKIESHGDRSEDSSDEE